MKRRDALKTLGALASAGAASRLLPGCTDGDGAAQPGAIEHLVVLMMENRTYDHLLGARSLVEGKPGDGIVAGFSNPDSAGDPVAVWRATPDTLCVLDPPHGWGPSHEQFNGGALDGFLREHQARHPGDLAAMQYLVREHVPVTWALADHYASCDRWFASLMGPTWPNRMYWHTGQSNGILANDLPDSIDWATIYDRLNARGVPWRYYFGDLPVLAAVGRLVQDENMRPFTRFLDDAANGDLPPVTYLDPAFGFNDDHPPHHPIFGQQLIAAIYTALATSPLWPKTLFVITYDEHGGFFDHVAPPKTADDRAADGFDQLGFRVPTVVIGPYVKQGVISTQYDHTSVLKHIETMFGLDPLTARTTAASDLTDCLDLERMAAGDWAEAAPIPEVVVDESMVGGACAGSQDVHHDVIEWFDSTGDRWKHLDRRRYLRDYAYDLGDYLDRKNAGRIVRGR
jgi:phospholipase C